MVMTPITIQEVLGSGGRAYHWLIQKLVVRSPGCMSGNPLASYWTPNLFATVHGSLCNHQCVNVCLNGRVWCVWSTLSDQQTGKSLYKLGVDWLSALAVGMSVYWLERDHGEGTNKEVKWGHDLMNAHICNNRTKALRYVMSSAVLLLL